jgi:hypothetical protein
VDKLAEHRDEGPQAFRAIGVEIERVVVEEALADGQPDADLAHVVLDDRGRGAASACAR